MGFFDFLGDVAGTVLMGAIDSVETVGRGIEKVGDTIVYGGCDMAESIVESITQNPGKAALVAVATVATGGAALAFAPAIGAAASAAGLGVAAGTLSGAAASSAGLAALGGGSLAAGGFGVAGGTAVVTAAGAVGGAAVSAGAVAAVG